MNKKSSRLQQSPGGDEEMSSSRNDPGKNYLTYQNKGVRLARLREYSDRDKQAVLSKKNRKVINPSKLGVIQNTQNIQIDKSVLVGKVNFPNHLKSSQTIAKTLEHPSGPLSKGTNSTKNLPTAKMNETIKQEENSFTGAIQGVQLNVNKFIPPPEVYVTKMTESTDPVNDSQKEFHVRESSELERELLVRFADQKPIIPSSRNNEQDVDFDGNASTQRLKQFNIDIQKIMSQSFDTEKKSLPVKNEFGESVASHHFNMKRSNSKATTATMKRANKPSDVRSHTQNEIVTDVSSLRVTGDATGLFQQSISLQKLLSRQQTQTSFPTGPTDRHLNSSLQQNLNQTAEASQFLPQQTMKSALSAQQIYGGLPQKEASRSQTHLATTTSQSRLAHSLGGTKNGKLPEWVNSLKKKSSVQMQQQIEAQAKEIQYLKKINKDILTSNYHNSQMTTKYGTLYRGINQKLPEVGKELVAEPSVSVAPGNIFDHDYPPAGGREGLKTSNGHFFSHQNAPAVDKDSLQTSLLSQLKPEKSKTDGKRTLESTSKVTEQNDLLLGPRVEGLAFKKEVKKLRDKLENEAYEVLNSSKEVFSKENILGILSELGQLLQKARLMDLSRVVKLVYEKVEAFLKRKERDRLIEIGDLNKQVSDAEDDKVKLNQTIKSLEKVIQEEKESFERFLKRTNQEGIIHQIKEYESMGPLTYDDSLLKLNQDSSQQDPKVALQVFFERFKFMQEQKKSENNYSGLNEDLQELFFLLSIRDDEDKLNLPKIKDALKTNRDKMEMLNMLEDEIVFRFRSVQSQTARKVLHRCLKKVETEDRGTQMGIDMFAKERNELNETITLLKDEVAEMQILQEQVLKKNEELMNSKTRIIQDLRSVKTDNQLISQELSELKVKSNEWERELRVAQDLVLDKIGEIDQLTEETTALYSKVSIWKDKYDLKAQSLEQKREKKKKYKRELLDLQETGGPEALALLQQEKEDLQMKLNRAVDRLNTGMIRKVKKVPREAKTPSKPPRKSIILGSQKASLLASKLETQSKPDSLATPPENEIENESDCTEKSFYMTFDEYLKRRGSISKASAGTYDDNEGPGFANILSDEEYFNVMKTIGILDEEQVNEDNFDKDDAWKIINKWFESSPERKSLRSSTKDKIKNTLASEFTKRLSASPISPQKLRQLGRDLPKPDESKVDSEVICYTPAEMSSKRLTQHPPSNIKIQSKRPSLKKITAAEAFWGEGGTPKAPDLMKKSSASYNQSVNSNRQMAVTKSVISRPPEPVSNPGEEMQRHSLLGQKVDRVEIEVLSDEDMNQKSLVPRSVPNQKLNFAKSMKDIIDRIEIKTKLPDSEVQTDIVSRDYFFVKKDNLQHASTQTQECYFPFDEETRKMIANILGSRLGKQSDKVMNNFQSFLNQINPQDFYIMQTNLPSKQFEARRQKIKKFEPLFRRHRGEQDPTIEKSIRQMNELENIIDRTERSAESNTLKNHSNGLSPKAFNMMSRTLVGNTFVNSDAQDLDEETNQFNHMLAPQLFPLDWNLNRNSSDERNPSRGRTQVVRRTVARLGQLVKKSEEKARNSSEESALKIMGNSPILPKHTD